MVQVACGFCHALTPFPVWWTWFKAMFMTSSHLVNFIQSERMLHFLRCEECEEGDCVSKYKSKMAENVDDGIEKACLVFGVTKLLSGFGKSLVFQMALLVHVGLLQCNLWWWFCFKLNPIVVVISPLLNHMEAQTNFFTGSGNLGWVDRRR